MKPSLLPGSWDDLVVICATTPWDGHRLLDQHVATQLAKVTPVLYVEPPVPMVQRGRSGPAVRRSEANRGLRLLKPGLAGVTPSVPPLHQRPGMKSISLAVTRRAMRRAVQDLGGPSVRAVIVPSLNPLFGACGERFRVFYAKDDYVAGARLMRIAPRRLRRRDQRQPADADVVVTVSEVLADRYRAMGHDPLVIPNGCDVEHYADGESPPPLPGPELDHPVAGYVGSLTGRLDLPVLDALADAGTSILLVGGRSATADNERLDRLLARDRVRWEGARPFDELPAYLAGMDVGLVPYAPADPFNRASSPLKVLEYLAAGLPVVSTDLPAVRALDTDLVTFADGPAAFAAAVATASRSAHDPELVARRHAFAAAHSWAERVDRLARVLELPSIPSHAGAARS